MDKCSLCRNRERIERGSRESLDMATTKLTHLNPNSLTFDRQCSLRAPLMNLGTLTSLRLPRLCGSRFQDAVDASSAAIAAL